MPLPALEPSARARGPHPCARPLSRSPSLALTLFLALTLSLSRVLGRYNHRGTLGIRGALTTRPTGGFDSSVSVAESDVTTATGRPDRVTNSPSGKFHPNPDRRFELRQSDMFSNINYFATSRVTNATSKTGDAVYGAPDNDRKMKEASWISSQAWFESLRYYPQGEEAAKNDDCPVTFSGNTHGEHTPSTPRTAPTAARPNRCPPQPPPRPPRVRATPLTRARRPSPSPSPSPPPSPPPSRSPSRRRLVP